MTLLAFEAETDIEHQNSERPGRARFPATRCCAGWRRHDLFIPSAGEVQDRRQRLQPGAGRSGRYALCGRFHRHVAATKGHGGISLMRMNGRQFFRRLPAGYGIMVNPGYEAQILVPPHGMAAFEAGPGAVR